MNLRPIILLYALMLICAFVVIFVGSAFAAPAPGKQYERLDAENAACLPAENL